MVAGYFHYKCKNQVLTAYYEILSAEEEGQLLFSSSLWRRNKKQKRGHNWNRKEENRHAYENFLRGPVEVFFVTDREGDKYVNLVYLRKYIHTQLANPWGRQCRTFREKSAQFYQKSDEKDGIYSISKRAREYKAGKVYNSDQEFRANTGQIPVDLYFLSFILYLLLGTFSRDYLFKLFD